MIYFVFREDNNVIQVNYEKLIDYASKSDVHYSLESGTSIYESKGHLSISVSAPWSAEGGFELVWRGHQDLVIP